MAGNLSDCAPIVSNGKAIWYTWKNQFNTFYEISLNDLSSNHAARIENGHKYNYADKAENALLTGTCRVCGYQKQFSVPVELDVQKKDASNTFYQEMKEIYQMEPGGTADILWYSYFASANKDYDQITNWKISSSDESIVSVEQTGKNTFTITALKPGFATFTIQEKTNPSAVFTAKIYVNMISDDTASWYLPSSYFVFDGTEHKPSVHLKVNNKLLTEGTDYEITYDGDLINAGTVKLTVTGIGVYTGSVETTYNIQKLSMSNASFSVAPAYYTGSEVTPEVTVTHSGKTLVKDRDFIVTYHNNIEPSSYYNSPWVGIDGIGNYQGYVTKSFTINRADISSCTVTLSNESLTYTGSSLRPNATVKSGDKTLAAGTDFTVSYKDNVKEGTAAVTITGAGNYTGIINTTFTITAAPGKDDSDSGKDNPGKNDSDKGNQNSSTPGNNNNNNNGNTSGNNDQNNNGQNNNNTNNNNNNQNNSSNNEANNDTAITPVPAVINASDITLTKSKKKANIITSIESDGKVSLKSSNTKVVKISGTKVIPVNPGKANVTITVAAGTRYAAASKTVTITVIPAKTSLRSVKSKTAKQATVTWKKAKSISGYQISYSQNSSMKKAKALTVKGSATRATLKKLVSKKKYYVRIRTYKVVSGKKYYSKWSSKKSVKIR